jgi:hypothetical protein
MDPVPDQLLLMKSGSAGNRTWDLWLCGQRRSGRAKAAVTRRWFIAVRRDGAVGCSIPAVLGVDDPGFVSTFVSSEYSVV